MKNIRKILGIIFFGSIAALLLFGLFYPKPEHVKSSTEIECEMVYSTVAEIRDCIHRAEWIEEMEQILKRIKDGREKQKKAIQALREMNDG